MRNYDACLFFWIIGVEIFSWWGTVLQDLDQGGCFWWSLQLGYYGEGSSVKGLQLDHDL